MRALISAASHRLFAWSERLGAPGLYLRSAKALLYTYQALAYSRGRLGQMFDRLER